MGRPATHHEERKIQIVEAALEVFAQKGYDGTSNRLIAQAAGLNSAALIYHYFPSKTELFKASLEHISALKDLHEQIIQGQDDPPEVYLRRVGLAYMHILQTGQTNRLMLMILSALQSHKELLPILMGRISEAIIFPLLQYFSGQVEAGHLKAISPISAGQQFMGGMFFRAFIASLLGDAIPIQMPSEEEYLDSYVKVFLDGIRQKPGI